MKMRIAFMAAALAGAQLLTPFAEAATPKPVQPGLERQTGLEKVDLVCDFSAVTRPGTVRRRAARARYRRNIIPHPSMTSRRSIVRARAHPSMWNPAIVRGPARRFTPTPDIVHRDVIGSAMSTGA